MRRHQAQDRQPQGGEDRAKYDKLRDHLLRLDDEVTCKTCGKKFEVPSHHSLLFTRSARGPAEGRRRRCNRGGEAAFARRSIAPSCRRAFTQTPHQGNGAADVGRLLHFRPRLRPRLPLHRNHQCADRSPSRSARHHPIVGCAVAGRAHRAPGRRTVSGRSRHRGGSARQPESGAPGIDRARRGIHVDVRRARRDRGRSSFANTTRRHDDLGSARRSALPPAELRGFPRSQPATSRGTGSTSTTRAARQSRDRSEMSTGTRRWRCGCRCGAGSRPCPMFATSRSSRGDRDAIPMRFATRSAFRVIDASSSRRSAATASTA